MSGFLGAYEDSSEEGDDAPSILARAAASTAGPAEGAAAAVATAAASTSTPAAPAASSPATASGSPGAVAASASPPARSPPDETDGGSAPSSPSSDAGSGVAAGALLPPSPTGEPDEEILERVRSLHELRKKGKSIRDHIQGSRDWSNPYILERVIKVFEIDQYGSNYPKEIFNPAGIAEHPSDFFDAPECERPPPPKRSRQGTKRNGVVRAESGSLAA